MRTFIAELKRRKVFRVALAYTAAAWALLQAADIVLPLLGLPEGSLRILLYVIAGGFPLALLLSWLFDLSNRGIALDTMRPQARPTALLSTAHIVQFGLICALVVLVGYLYYEKLYTLSSDQRATSAAPPGQSIAVLPFANMSDDAANVYFSDGVSEELLNVLAKVSGLRVAARTSSFHYRHRDDDVKTIGQQLDVATLLEGSVRKTGDMVRITAQLIDTGSGYHLWSETYDGKLDDIFALQDKVARAVVHAIRPMLMDQEAVLAGPSTSNFDAYNAYLKGQGLLRQPWTDRVLAQAVDQFTVSAQLDPDYPDAQAGLCDARLAQYSHSRATDSFALAERACQKALAKSGSALPGWDVQVALGVLYRTAGQYEQSLEALRIAEDIGLGRQRTLEELGMTHAAAGRLEVAEEYLQRAIEVDENNWDSYLILANFYIESARYQKAEQAYNAVLAKVPDLPSALIGKGSALYMQGMENDAETLWMNVVNLARASDTGSMGIAYTNLGLLYYYRGDYKQAASMHEAASRYIGDDHRVWGRIAESYRALGQQPLETENYRRAIPLAQESLTHNPQNWETLGLLGLYYGHLGRPEEALEYTQKMLALNESPPTAHYFAALVHWALDDPESTYREIERAIASGFAPDLLRDDPDLARLRELDPERFEALIGNPD